MDLNFSVGEIAAITALLGVMATTITFMMRQFLTAKQETINAKQETIIEQAKVILKQDAVHEREIGATEELRDVVKDQSHLIGEQNRELIGLRAQVGELLREMSDRRPFANEAFKLWLDRNGGTNTGSTPKREER